MLTLFRITGEKEETKAFFDLYKNTVQTNDETFQHDNLAPDEDSSSDDNGGEEEDDDDLASEGEGAVRKTITQKQIREEIRLARKRKRAAVADDEEEEPRRSQEPEPRKKSWYDDSDAEPDSDDGLPRQLQSRNPLRKAKPKASVAAARTAFRSRGEDSDEDPTLAMVSDSRCVISVQRADSASFYRPQAPACSAAALRATSPRRTRSACSSLRRSTRTAARAMRVAQPAAPAPASRPCRRGRPRLPRLRSVALAPLHRWLEARRLCARARLACSLASRASWEGASRSLSRHFSLSHSYTHPCALFLHCFVSFSN